MNHGGIRRRPGKAREGRGVLSREHSGTSPGATGLLAGSSVGWASRAAPAGAASCLHGGIWCYGGLKGRSGACEDTWPLSQAAEVKGCPVRDGLGVRYGWGRRVWGRAWLCPSLPSSCRFSPAGWGSWLSFPFWRTLGLKRSMAEPLVGVGCWQFPCGHPGHLRSCQRPPSSTRGLGLGWPSSF